MRRLIVERSEHPGHAPIRVGTITSRLHAGEQQYDPVCERCGRTLQPQESYEKAESLLRQHRLKCRPRIDIRRLEPIAPPRGMPYTATEGSEHAGHPPIRIGRIYHDGANTDNTTSTRVCERCSHWLQPGPSHNEAVSTLRKHRKTCRPGVHGRRASQQKPANKDRPPNRNGRISQAPTTGSNGRGAPNPPLKRCARPTSEADTQNGTGRATPDPVRRIAHVRAYENGQTAREGYPDSKAAPELEALEKWIIDHHGQTKK